jgi:hypothetical protein
VKKRTTTGGIARNRKTRAENIEAFLAAYARHGLIKPAARDAGITKTNHHNWLKDVPGYAERFGKIKVETLARVGPKAERILYRLAVRGVAETIRDNRGAVVWDPVDADGRPVPPDSKLKAGVRKATRRVWDTRALLALLKAWNPEVYGDKQKLLVSGAVAHTHDASEDVKKLLADRESLDLANALARRMAFNAGGNGQSSN